MKQHSIDKVTWHVVAAIDWARAVGELFPALWDAAKVFAPLVLDYCGICKKPLSVLWIPVGDHDVCDLVDGLEGAKDA
jgi:hypothetical protein